MYDIPIAKDPRDNRQIESTQSVRSLMDGTLFAYGQFAHAATWISVFTTNSFFGGVTDRVQCRRYTLYLNL